MMKTHVKKIGANEVAEKLLPIAKKLMAEGRKNQFNISNRTLLTLASEMQDHLDRWCNS